MHISNPKTLEFQVGGAEGGVSKDAHKTPCRVSGGAVVGGARGLKHTSSASRVRAMELAG